ncbi:MAG: hypothetical protein KDA44_12115 [Planctomycetales bacterium]|nr:hypothetical protein [Planctomycetales bacterium]
MTRRLSPMTNLRLFNILAAVALAACWTASASARYADRWYRMGDDPAQNASAGPVTTDTFDSAGSLGMNQLHDLTPSGSPLYVNIAGDRPIPAVTNNNWAIQFDGVDDYLLGPNLNNPSQSIAQTTGGENYAGIEDRGYQFWVKPQSLPATGSAVMVDDGEEHEFRVTSTGFWSPETRNSALTTTTAATLNVWTHISQVRPNGVAGGSLSWVNGIAVASQTGDYDLLGTTGLVVGANASPDGVGGTTIPPVAYFNGLIDELELFVLGGSYGAFAYTKDNGYFTDVFLPSQAAAYSYVDATGPRGGPDGHNDKVWVAGDINFDGQKTQADVDAFVAGWRSSNADAIVGAGPGIGDYLTLGQGDLDLDGDTDIDDFVVLRTAFAGVAVAMPTAAQLASLVPEPGTVGLALVAGLFGVAAQVRRKQG